MQLFNIKFEGFYESLHSNEIDYQLEGMYTNEDGIESEIPDDINYPLLYSEYSKLYVQAFAQVINEKLSIDIKLVFKELISPQEYNFVTDSIDVELSESDFTVLKVKMLSIDGFTSYVNEASKSYDGFTSFYTGIDEVSDDDEILLMYIGMYLINNYGDEINQCLQDDFDIGELVCSCDFILTLEE